MPMFLAAEVQRGPVAVPVKRDAITSFVEVVELFEALMFDDA